MSNPPLASGELYTLTTVYQLCCNNAMKAYTQGKKSKLSPTELLPLGAELESCVSKVSVNIGNDCKESYASLKECLSTNPKGFTKCQEIRNALEKCAVKNGLGELGA